MLERTISPSRGLWGIPVDSVWTSHVPAVLVVYHVIHHHRCRVAQAMLQSFSLPTDRVANTMHGGQEMTTLTALLM